MRLVRCELRNDPLDLIGIVTPLYGDRDIRSADCLACVVVGRRLILSGTHKGFDQAFRELRREQVVVSRKPSLVRIG